MSARGLVVEQRAERFEGPQNRLIVGVVFRGEDARTTPLGATGRAGQRSEQEAVVFHIGDPHVVVARRFVTGGTTPGGDLVEHLLEILREHLATPNQIVVVGLGSTVVGYVQIDPHEHATFSLRIHVDPRLAGLVGMSR